MTGRVVPFTAIVPARRASTRLPDKPLADIGGLPMVVRVAMRAKASGATRVIVAVDDEVVRDAVAAHGHEVVLTSPTHASGTDRLAEVVENLGLPHGDLVVNVQGDEPLIDPALIARCAAVLADAPDCAMATAAHPIADHADFVNPNVVKVVADAQGRALYFSRAPIPWARDAYAHGGAPSPIGALRHIGLYAYRAGFLATFARLAPAPLETLEALEQLRALWHGHRIALFETAEAPAPGVDTPEDLARVRALVAGTPT